MPGWQDLTVQDLEDMGLTLDEFEQMMEEGNNPFATDYESMGILDPIDISPQATQWDILDAQKTARESNRPPTQYERRLDRSSYGMPEDAFTYDIVNQANPYIRALLNEAISSSEPGPNQSFDAREYVMGRIEKDEGKRKGVREGKTRIGQAAREAYDRGDFETIADQFHQDDERWATTDKKEQLELLKQWLNQEAEGALSGGAPSVSRNVNFSDWALNRDEGEQFEMGGVGFDREPQLQFDERYWGRNRTPGMEAQLGMADFRKAYKGSLASQLGKGLKSGQRIDDPDQGGYWVINENIAELTPLQRARMRNREVEQRRAKMARNRKSSGDGGRSWLDRNVTGPLSSLTRFGR